MKISNDGLDIIKHFEGLKLESYICPAGKLTIGWGHTGEEVRANMRITIEEATALLLQDVAVAEKSINSLNVSLRQCEFDALCSFIFNIGVGAFEKSAMCKFIRAGDIPAAADQFKRWVFSKGKKLAGLEKRRNLEYRLFIGETINDLELDRLIDTIREEIKYTTGAAKKEEYDQILKYLLEDKILRERLNRIMGCKNDL